MGKGLTGIRKSAKETLPDEEESELSMQTSLLAIANKAKDRKHYRFLNLYRLIGDENFLLECWRDIRKNAASGVDRISAKRSKTEHKLCLSGGTKQGSLTQGPLSGGVLTRR